MSDTKRAVIVVSMAAFWMLIMVMGLLLPSYFASDNTASADPVLPNVVVIMIDDGDYALITRLINSTTNGSSILAPIKTHLVDAGTTFTNAYAATGVCCPSRATFLSGQYPHNHGVLGNLGPSGGEAFSDTHTLATWLDDQGYYTALIGKYLNEHGNDPDEDDKENFHSPYYVPPQWDEWHALVHTDTIRGVQRMQNYALHHSGTITSSVITVYTNTYQTDHLAALAAHLITTADGTENSDDKPFFLFLAPTVPHSEDPAVYTITGCSGERSESIRPHPTYTNTLALPLATPESFNEANLSDKPQFMQLMLPTLTVTDTSCVAKQYDHRSEALRSVGDLVQTVVDALDSTNELNRTVIIFTSDNGYFLGEHRLYEKLIPYEEAMRVPLIIRVPSTTTVTPGQVVTQLVLLNDLAPTIVDLAQAELEVDIDMDGRSLWPLIDNPLFDWGRLRFLTEFSGTVNVEGVPPFHGVRTSILDENNPNQFYVQWTEGISGTEFYDLRTDPYQLTSTHNTITASGYISILVPHLNALKVCEGPSGEPGSCQIVEDADDD